MYSIEELKQAIEVARKELDESIETVDFEKTYEKSKELDKLIETYIEMSSDCN